MYAPAQALQQALNRRLQRQQMEQSGEIADQNNAMQLLSQGQAASQADQARDAALERLKEQATTQVMRSQLGADARVRSTEAVAAAREAAADRLAASRENVAGKGFDARAAHDETMKEIAKITGSFNVKKAQAMPRAGKGNQRPTAEVMDINSAKGLESTIREAKKNIAKAETDPDFFLIQNESDYNAFVAKQEKTVSEAQEKLKALRGSYSGQPKK